MNSNAFQELRMVIETPNRHVETLSVVPESIRIHLSSKQTLHLNNEERDEIFSSQEKSGLSSRLYKLYCNFPLVGIETTYPSLLDGYETCEYFGRHNTCVITDSYLRYIKQSKDGFIINMYNYSKLNGINSIYDERVKFVEDNEIPDYEFNIPDQIVYSIFDEVLYNPNIDLNSYLYKSPLININIPYDYYSKIIIPENIYYYDIDSKYHWFCGKSKEELDSIVGDMTQNGIQTPLMMRIKHGVIRSADDDTYLYILLAKHLRLPTIPASIFIGDENAIHPDTIDQYIPLSEDELKYVNLLFEPYFQF